VRPAVFPLPLPLRLWVLTAPQFLGRHESAGRVAACFGEHWPRLRALKAEYDPHGMFKNTYWPLDVDGEPVAPLSNEPRSPYPDYY
jgi:hypothetical protein